MSIAEGSRLKWCLRVGERTVLKWLWTLAGAMKIAVREVGLAGLVFCRSEGNRVKVDRCRVCRGGMMRVKEPILLPPWDQPRL